jgi:hypothetical protein
LVDTYYAARQPWARAMVQRHEELEERFGDPADRGYTPEIRAAAAEINARVGLDAASAQLSAVHEEMEPIADAINAMPCTSIAGLRVKALVAFWGVAPLLLAGLVLARAETPNHVLTWQYYGLW